MIKIHVDLHGTIPSGLWSIIMHQYKADVIETIGDEGVHRIRTYLHTQYKYLGNNGGTPLTNPVPPNAGWYATNIRTHLESAEHGVITDSNVPYGPWLEGIAASNWIVWPHRRNPPARRFPGYFAFRKISAQLDLEAGKIAEQTLPRYLGELNA
jgi:hypothetical protein